VNLLFPSSSSTSMSSTPPLPTLESIQRRNLGTALAAVSLAILSYVWQFTHPSYSPIQLLVQMQASSSDLSIIGSNGRPTLVDFWAPWCENCKLEAATLQSVHQKYDGRVNFVMVNGDDPSPRSGLAIDSFGVDVVPHMALIAPNGNVETALVGLIPQHVIEADLDTLLLFPQSSSTVKDGTSTNDVDSLSLPHTASPSTTTSTTPALPFTMLDTFAYRPEQRTLHFDPPE
jgi:thiol-disulfide isomerase/thioredoxin